MFFFFNDTATTEIYTLSLHDALPICEPAYLYLLRREFEEYGTKIRALNDRGDDSPEGELTDSILDQLAKYERAKIAERTRRGKLRKAREGKVVTPTPKFGFRLNEPGDALEIGRAS